MRGLVSGHPTPRTTCYDASYQRGDVPLETVWLLTAKVSRAYSSTETARYQPEPAYLGVKRPFELVVTSRCYIDAASVHNT